MSRTPSNQGMTGLHPVSQVSFRLSQVPPSRHRKARMHIDRAESIEDDESIEGLLTAISNDEYSDMVNSGGGCRLDAEPSTPLTISSPMLSLSSMASSAHISTPPSRCLPQLRHGEHSQRRVPLLSISPNLPEQQPRKSILHPQFQFQFQFRSSETADYSSSQCRQTKDTHASSASPLRSVSVYRRSLANNSPDTTQNRHSLLSQRPNIAFQNGGCTGALTSPYNQQQQQQGVHLLSIPTTYASQTIGQRSDTNADTTPTKRPRKQGVSVSELQAVVSRAKSGYNIWWHRISSDSATSLASRRPSACLRAYISDIETVVSPHLYSASATVYKIFSSDLAPLEQGQSFTVLLSLSVCAAASPQTAENITGLLLSRDHVQTKASSGSDAIISTRQLRAVDIYQPMRITKSGPDISILASRFVFL